MSGPADGSLGGRWSGIYNYPAPRPPNSFEAVLSDVGGAIGGTISEIDDDPFGIGETLLSIVEGRREGESVTFTKMYDDLDRMPEPVFYRGAIQPDGNEISGTWEIAGQWSGTFLMVRSPGATERAEAEAGAEIPARGA